MWYFSIGGAKSIANINTGGKIIIFRQIHNAIITLSAPEGGQTSLTTSMGAMARFAPPGSAIEWGEDVRIALCLDISGVYHLLS